MVISANVANRILSRSRSVFFKTTFLRKYSGAVTDNFVLKSNQHVELENKTLTEYVYSRIEKFPSYIAFECSVTGRKITFDDLRVKARNLSKALRYKLNLHPNDVVALYLYNCPEFPIASLGIIEAQLVVTTLNPLYTAEEISRQLENSSAKAIITIYELLENAVKSNQLLKQKLPIICIKTSESQSLPQGVINFNELVDSKTDKPDFQPANPQDVVALPYSSGTTGLPKGVQLTHYNIVSNLCQLQHPEIRINEFPTADFQDITPAVLPMFHIYGFTVTTLNMMVNGCRTVTLPKFTPELYISVLDRYKVNILFAAPPLILFLTLHPDVKSKSLEALKFVMSGAAPLGAMDEERFLNKVQKPVFILQGYGLTETSPVVSMISPEIRDTAKNTAGSIGKPIPNTLVKIVAGGDNTGTPLGPNQSGELLVKGPQVMQGYLNNPAANQEVFTDGWLRTGDLGHYNEEGLLFITDRMKELIKVKGFQVAPAELEEIIRSHRLVEDAAVIGVPHPYYGEVPRAYVVPKKGNTFQQNELIDYVNEKVAKYKRLEGGIEIIEAIPKNSAGKILRKDLKKKFEQRQ